MVDGRVGCPCLACVLEMTAETAPLVPLQGTVSKKEKKHEDDDDDRADLRDIYEVLRKAINRGRVELAAEGDRVLLRDRENGLVHAEASKCLVDVGDQILEWCVNANEDVSDGYVDWGS